MTDIFPQYSGLLVVLTYLSFGVVAGIMVIHVILADHLIEKNYTSRISKLVVTFMWSAFKLVAIWGVFSVVLMTDKAYPEVANLFNTCIAITSLVGTVYFHFKFIRQNPFQD
jgi:hypothetical protein